MIGDIETIKHNLTDEVVNLLNKEYVALDVETTGLNPSFCTITEIGLALFKNGEKVREYKSLIYHEEDLNPHIIELTGITNEMLRSAPKGEVVFKEVADFLKSVLEEKVYIVAHNADFDMSFIKRTLEQYGYIGVIHYVDTLAISRKLVKGLNNYKQDTVASYFNIVNTKAHRALSDAITCGYILHELLNIYMNGPKENKIITKYDSLFEERIRERGFLYYNKKAIKYAYIEENEINASIGGEKVYSVKIVFNNDNFIGECSCPYEGNCKHMYAAILKYQENK